MKPVLLTSTSRLHHSGHRVAPPTAPLLSDVLVMSPISRDKQLETYVKASGVLGGGPGREPTVISPNQYKKRFRRAMSRYFVMVPGTSVHSA